MTRSDTPYSRFSSGQLILRDHLAADRTVMANERTLLAYVRTALAVFVTGATFLKFFEWTSLEVTGIVLMPLGVIILGVGVWRYLRVARDIGRLGRPTPDAPDAQPPAGA